MARSRRRDLRHESSARARHRGLPRKARLLATHAPGVAARLDDSPPQPRFERPFAAEARTTPYCVAEALLNRFERLLVVARDRQSHAQEVRKARPVDLFNPPEQTIVRLHRFFDRERHVLCLARERFERFRDYPRT